MPTPLGGGGSRGGPALKAAWPLLAALLFLALRVSGVLAPAERLAGDALLRGLPPRSAARVAAVLIDEASLREIGPWPWDRPRLAQAVEAARAAGARGIAVDLLLPEARPGDERLAQALAQGPSVLAVGVEDGGNGLWPAPALRSVPSGHVSFDLDRDGVVRRFAATRALGGRERPAFSVAAARLADPALAVPVGQTLRPGFRARRIPVIDAADLLAGRGLEGLRGRLVFLGASAAGLGDRVVTPVSPQGAPEPGVLVEAQAAEAFLDGDLLRPVPPLLEALLAFALAALGTALLSARNGRLWPLAAGLAALPFPLAAAFLRAGQVGAPVALTAALLLVGAAMAWVRAREGRRAARRAGLRIAELEGLQASLAEARKEEAEARRVVAHELKTPAASMRGLAQLLAQYDLSAEERGRVAGLVVSEASRLAQMVDALLDLERLRLRDPAKDARPLDFSALCRERVELLRAGNARVIADGLEPGLRVLGNPELLARVVENLVSNALKFSPEEAPVRLRLRAEGDAAVLEVEDRGPGIPPEERRRIFGRFARGSPQGLAPGLGLGLALVAEAVAWHRGSVTAEDGTAGGSLFRVRLPLWNAD